MKEELHIPLDSGCGSVETCRNAARSGGREGTEAEALYPQSEVWQLFS